MYERTWKTNLFIGLMLLPALLLSLGIVVYPIVNSIILSFQSPHAEGFTLYNYKFLFTDKMAVNSIVYTFWVTIVTVVLAMVISYMLALYLRFSDSKASKVISTLYLLPRFVPNLVAIYAMMAVIRDTGFINRITMLFGVNFKPGMLYNAKGIILMNLWFNVAFATMIIVAALSNIPDSIIESSRDVGANRIYVFFKMILPLSYKDVFIAMTFIFMGNISSFTTPYIIGPNQPIMLGVYLRKQFSEYLDYEMAAAVSVVIFLFSSVSALVYLYTNLKQSEWEKTGL